MTLVQRRGSGSEPQFVTEADWISGFWNYLLDLDRDDLVAELIQNDLDQDATRTVISFERDHLICEGNGRPVEPEGWQRLRKIQGAGDSVPAKRGKFGVKNHGLKTAFTIGDEIRLMSDGQSIVQTLYAKGRGKPPYPGASPNPIPDLDAPAEGCRIVVRYRHTPIEPRQGEAIVLAPVTAQEIDALFLSACASAPEQFAGIVSPEVAPHYEIALRHWRLGEAHFQFSCTRPRKIARGIELFRRRCAISGTMTPLPNVIHEQAVRRLTPLKGPLRKRVADYYRRGNRFFVEVSWPIDGQGVPCAGTGRFRYPIGYPISSHEARTGHSAYFNAPLASDNKRHSPARNEATNKELRTACEALLIDVLARHAIPRWSAAGLNPLVPSPNAENQDEAIRPLLAELVHRNAMPTLKWHSAVELLAKGKRMKVPVVPRQSAGRSDTLARRYNFIVPATTWEQSAVHPALSIISPPSELQIDPRIHPAILRLVADGRTAGFYDQFITFDENDAVRRATGKGNEYFKAPPDLAREFAQLLIARSYLDVIDEALARNKCDQQTEKALQASLMLPDVHGKPARLVHLHTSASLPCDVPGLRLPPVLHADLALHRLFRRHKWHRPKFTMGQFLDSRALYAADESTRGLFWDWLRQNGRRIAPRDRPKLADIPIWPDEGGNLSRLSGLCAPRSPHVAAVLAGSIRFPHEHVRRSELLSAGKRGRTSVRHLPNKDEIRQWLDQRMAAFAIGETADDSTVAALHRFEADLGLLLKDPGITSLLKATKVTLPTLARDGSIGLRTALVMPDRNIDRLALCDRLLLKSRKHAATLDKLSPPLSAPTAAMLLETFAEDSASFDALQPRLQQFLSVTHAGDIDRGRLADMPILPVHGQPHAPAMLALTGTKGDYWGAWKTRIPGRGLSQEDQRRYRAVGVTSSLPDRETSRAFFEWLSSHLEGVIERHVPCVLRHILHHDGPAHWAEIFTDTPFIPAKSRDGIRLVSLQTAQRTPVYLPDAGDIADTIIRSDPAILVAIDRVKEVTEPITEPLRRLGLRSLREAMREPERVSGSGAIASADQNVRARIAALHSPHFRRTFLKRLAELGVEPELVRHDWHDRLSRIGEIRFADHVEALYRLRGRSYPVEADGGFDPASGVFWMKRDHAIWPRSLYEGIAAALIFKPAARPVHLLALERALTLEIHDPSFGRPAAAGTGQDADKPSGDDTTRNEYDTQDDEDPDPGEAIFGHSPFTPDASRNIPKPVPIASRAARPLQRRSGPAGQTGRGKGNRDRVPAPELEKEHIETLKHSHYASHCQLCLCERLPQELAPAGSYIEWEEVRRRVVEAHHVDLKSAGGARHAGNLILLCKLHHDNYGRRLTRAAITAALRAKTTEKTIRFGTDADVALEVKGRQITLVISDTGKPSKSSSQKSM